MTRIDRNHIFTWACLFALLLLTPRVCAQTAAENAAKAAETRSTFVEYGKKYMGCPYISGATGPNAFDCSGFVYAVSRESIGYQLPRTVKNIYKFCKIIDDSQREPGDLVFFKTVAGDEPTHVGIYIGNDQFLNCASDGPNTGVILSSLKENYWKTKYYKSARFLPASKAKEDAADNSDVKKASMNSLTGSGSSKKSGTQTSAKKTSSTAKNNGSFGSHIVFDGSACVDWNFFTADYFRLNFRGLTTTVNAVYNGQTFKPGIGTSLRWDAGTGIVQIPLLFSLTMNEYFRIFAGPVFSIGTPYLPGNTDREIEASIFPGIIGICWNTASAQMGIFDISFTQDIHYTVFNETNGGALNPLRSFATGLVFSSGVRVTLPLSSLLK